MPNTIPGFSNDYGQLRVFDWSETPWPTWSGVKYVSLSSLSGGIVDLSMNHESDPDASYPVGNELMHVVNPIDPSPYPSWGYANYHHRSEIYNKPWSVDHPGGTEEWFGYTMRFPNTYVPMMNTWMNIAQIKNSTTNQSPAVKFMLSHGNDPNGTPGLAGELMVANNANDTGGAVYHPLGLAPQAGETWSFVWYIKHDRSPNGIIKIWGKKNGVIDKVNDVIYHQTNCHTVYGEGTGGNVKLGVYAPLLKYTAGVDTFLAEASEIKIFFGPWKIISNRSSDPNYGVDYFDTVKPGDATPPPVDPPGPEPTPEVVGSSWTEFVN